MRNYPRIFIFLLLSVLSVQMPAQQKRITEATITYDVIINTSNPNPRGADMLDGATNVIYLKGNSSRSELISSLGKESTLIDGNSGGVTVLKDYGDKNFMITMTRSEWEELNKKYEGIIFTYHEEYKKILEYTCQKATGKLRDGTTFTVFFAKDLLPVNRNFHYLNKNLPGLAMQYEASIGNTMVIYKISGINFNPVPAQKFDLPKLGYRVLTYEESLKISGKKE